MTLVQDSDVEWWGLELIGGKKEMQVLETGGFGIFIFFLTNLNVYCAVIDYWLILWQ